MNKSKFLLFFILFCSFCYLCQASCATCVSGSYLTVFQLGYGWIVPDEQADADYNPATIYNIEGRRLFFAYSMDDYISSNIQHNYYGRNTFLVIPFDKLKCAIRYKTLSKEDYEKYSIGLSEITHNIINDDFGLTAFFSYPVKYNFKTGLSVGINTNDYDSSYEGDLNIYDSFDKNYSNKYHINTGVIFELNETWGIGGSFGIEYGISKFNKSFLIDADNLKLKISLLLEFRVFRPESYVIVRSFLSLFYESALTRLQDYILWITEDESYYNLNMETGLGLYYEMQDKTIINCGIKYNYIFDNKVRNYIYNIINTTRYSGFDILVFVGMDKPVLYDWFHLRFVYNILKVKNYDTYFYREQNSFLVSKDYRKESEIIFLPELINNIILGATIKFGDNILFNVNFGKNLFYIYSYNERINSIKIGIDMEIIFMFE